MRLYNVTFRHTDDWVLMPSIPISAAPDEDKTIKRVCFTDSVKNSVRALPPAHRDLRINAELTIRSVKLENLDGFQLLFPETLAKRKLAPDAMINHEYWYTAPVNVTVEHAYVIDFKAERTIVWDMISQEQMRDILTKMKLPVTRFVSPKRMYELACASASYDEQDELDEQISELPWAQGWDISELKLRYF